MLVPIEEIVARRLCEVHFSPEWVVKNHGAIGSVYMSRMAGAKVWFNCPPEVTGVWLLKHGWSGVAKIDVAGAEANVDLQSELEQRSFVAKFDPKSDGGFEFTLEVGVPEKGDSARAEVWILGLEFGSAPPEMSRSQVVSNTCRFVSGDWGKFLVLNSDTVIPRGILAEGCWAPRDVELFKEFIAPGSVVMDIGANFGHHSVVFSKLVGREGLVVSVEAQRAMFQLLNANCIVNGCDNVIPLHMAASDQVGVLRMYPIDYHGENNFGSLGVNREASASAGEEVPAYPLDDVVEEKIGSRKVDFLKLDVQSHEKFVFLGMLRTIRKHKPTIFFEVAPYWNARAGYHYRELYEILAPFGYKFRHFQEHDVDAIGCPKVDTSVDVEWDVLAYVD